MSFRAAAETFLQADQIIDGGALIAYQENVSVYERRIPLVLRPRGTSEVQHIVRLAQKLNTPLYPISRGRNWGMGSRLPVQEGSVVLDLSEMRTIRKLDEEFGTVDLEPGVTQGALAEYLREQKSRFFCDVTGSGIDTSIIGNACERGVAYNSLRADMLIQLEVVLGTGEVLRTGFGHYPQAKNAHLYRYGVGPDMQGLFLQSNLGIITCATMKLMARAPYQSSFMINLKREEDLGPLVVALRELKRDGVFDCVVHIGNRYRRLTAAAPTIFDYYQKQGRPIDRAGAEALVEKKLSSAWSAIGTLRGPKNHVKYAERVLKKELARFGSIMILTAEKIRFGQSIAKTFGLHSLAAFLDAAAGAYGMTYGQPSNNALKSVYWPQATTSTTPDQPDKSPAGLLFCLPIIPMSAAAVDSAVHLAHQVAEAHGFRMAMTLNLLHDTALEGVFNIDFPRQDPSRVQAAHTCIQEMTRAFAQHGFMPYRLDIETMPIMIDPQDLFWQKAKEIKKVFDPHNIIAPGRYGIP